MQQLDSISQGPDGFWQYLYERCREQSISSDGGATQLVEIGESFEVKDITEKREVFKSILSTKESYEKGRRAELQATEIIGHFVDLDGVWDLRPVFHRETGEIITKLPVLIMNVTWHDSTSTRHVAVFQLAERDWEEFKSKIDKLENHRKIVQREVKKT